MKRVCLVVVLLAWLPVVAVAADKSSNLQFLIIKDYNGKPVRNASVILHPVNKYGKQDRGGYQLKTDAEGRTSFAGVPYGTLRVQVLAQGFQTYGEDYSISQPATDITIKLKRPNGQYSVYDDKNQGSSDQKDKNPQP